MKQRRTEVRVYKKQYHTRRPPRGGAMDMCIKGADIWYGIEIPIPVVVAVDVNGPVGRPLSPAPAPPIADSPSC
jgi:hypothetical protein